MIEILAPAGSMEHLRTAVFGGADGVYLGTKEFSARQNAENFTLEQLEEAVRFCHERGVSVYVAVNTVIKNSELSSAVKLAASLSEINVDGVIIQDLAVAKIFREVSPRMPLHASTQMAVHNLSGAVLLRELGFTRVVLARELTFEEIKTITENCGIETEVFVHGAHCMSASGMCYLSSFIGGRSGNRGRCAQPCRLDFKVGNKNFCLSLKDMCYIDYVEKLNQAGVASLKIEGRMKRPEYAFMASKTYKKALLGEDASEEMKLLGSIFSRSGFTDGYIADKLNRDMFGYRKKEDVESSVAALKQIGKMEETYKIPVCAKVEIEKDKPLKLTFTSGENSVSVFSEEIITENTKLPASDRIEASIRKTGGTPFAITEFDINSEVDLKDETQVLPISALNSLRRKGIDMLSVSLSKREKKEIKEYCIPKFSTKKRECSEIRIRLENANQLKYIEDFKGKIILPINEAEKILDKFDKSRIILELPFLVYHDDENNIIELSKELYQRGFNSVLCENISLLSEMLKIGFTVHGGAYMNVINPLSLSEYIRLGVVDMTLSPEINSADLFSFDSEAKTGIMSYGFLPLMQFRSCPIKAHLGCEKCGGEGEFTDRLNNRFPVICRKKYVSLLNTVPVSLSGKNLNVDFQTLYFTKESPLRVSEILKDFMGNREPDYPHTKGLYFRKVL